MLPPLIQRQGRSHRQRERGVTMALVALSMVAIISMAALSIDIGTLYQASAEAQRAADAAALAGARVISMSGLTGDPTNGGSGGTVSWGEICGGMTSPASLAAIAIGQQNAVGRVAPTITVTYSAGSAPASPGNVDCSGVGTGFGVNPVVTAKVQQPNLPIFFARIFSLIPGVNYTSAGVTATASAEAFNSSDAGTYAVSPRCVKPWIVPNFDPAGGLCTTGCPGFVDTTDGAIKRPGILADGSGVIGETFWLIPDCNQPGSPNVCSLLNTPQPLANQSVVNELGFPNSTVGSLEYVPGLIATSSGSTAIPACSAYSVSGSYAQAIAGCDQATKYQCGSSQANTVDLTENPVHPNKNGDTSNGGECLIHEDPSAFTGQDQLLTAVSGTYPFQIQAGANNPMVSGGLTANTLITSSTSIVSLPIYDQTASAITQSVLQPTVTVVGFLQVFINSVDQYGNVNVTVMNVTGCAPNGGTNPTLNGTSSVPVRLITAP